MTGSCQRQIDSIETAKLEPMRTDAIQVASKRSPTLLKRVKALIINKINRLPHLLALIAFSGVYFSWRLRQI
jgi:hypothetical protein